MKIRILGNSIRFRLNKPEVEQLCALGKVTQKTQFKDALFYYAVELSAEATSLSAEFDGKGITFFLPQTMAARWDKDDRIGFQATVNVNDQEALSLLLEKDFTCLVPRGEDESEHYPNPKSIQ